MITRRSILPALAATLMLPAVAAQAQSYNVSGNYTAYGMNADGSRYQGQVRITQTGDAVDVFWSVGSQAYAGRGVIEGRVVTVNWGASAPVIYVLVGQELHGTWDGGTALERLVRQ